MKTVKIELPDEDADALEQAAIEGGFRLVLRTCSWRRSETSSPPRSFTIPTPWPETSPSTWRRNGGEMPALRPKKLGPG